MSLREAPGQPCIFDEEELRLTYDYERRGFIAFCKKCGTRYLFDHGVSVLTTEDGRDGIMDWNPVVLGE